MEVDQGWTSRNGHPSRTEPSCAGGRVVGWTCGPSVYTTLKLREPQHFHQKRTPSRHENAWYMHEQEPVQRRSIVRSVPWLVRLLPEFAADLGEPLPSLPPDDKPRLKFEAVAEYLLSPRLDGRERSLGTVLVLDDLQWAGPDALELLSALVKKAPGENDAPLRLIGAYRDTEVQPVDVLSRTLADLVPGRLATELLLSPLEPPAAAQLAQTLMAESEQSALDFVQQRAGGIPFFLIGLAEVSQLGKPGVPRDLAQSVRSRIVTLSQDSREILELASLIGNAVPHKLLLAVSAGSEEVVARALDLLYRSKLLALEGESSSRFANDVIRVVVEQDIGSASRTLMRRRIERVRSELGSSSR
jgi:predicted ATPase